MSKRPCTWLSSDHRSLSTRALSSSPFLPLRRSMLPSRAHRPNQTASYMSLSGSLHRPHSLSCLRCMHYLPSHSMRVRVPPQQRLASLLLQLFHQKSAQRGVIGYHTATPRLRMPLAIVEAVGEAWFGPIHVSPTAGWGSCLRAHNCRTWEAA